MVSKLCEDPRYLVCRDIRICTGPVGDEQLHTEALFRCHERMVPTSRLQGLPSPRQARVIAALSEGELKALKEGSPHLQLSFYAYQW